MNRELIRRLPELVAPNGILFVEEHLNVVEKSPETPLAGPTNPAFLAAPGELPALLDGMDALLHQEAIITDPDGRRVALARFIGKQPGSQQRA